MTTFNRLSSERGFGLAELIVVVAIVGIITALGVPSLLSYWQASRVSAGAEELAAVLNRARHLAVRQNTTVCVERTGTNVRMRTGGCGGTIWTGVGTDGAGLFRIANELQVGTLGGNAIFTSAGGATASAGAMPLTYSVTDPATARTRNVLVQSTGRVTIQ
jgi:prepilin-type N-terminal cleavage/methylation domain-containing protein